jgi:hypothetical protein
MEYYLYTTFHPHLHTPTVDYYWYPSVISIRNSYVRAFFAWWSILLNPCLSGIPDLTDQIAMDEHPFVFNGVTFRGTWNTPDESSPVCLR